MQAELGSWLRPAGSPYRDGIPATLAAVPHAGVGRLTPRRFGPPTDSDGVSGSGVGRLPVTVLLSTSRDDVTSWLRAGVVLQEMLLYAARHSVYASIHTQPLEVPAMRAWLAALVGGRHPQMLLQLGHADSAPATPRRPPADVLTVRRASG